MREPREFDKSKSMGKNETHPQPGSSDREYAFVLERMRAREFPRIARELLFLARFVVRRAEHGVVFNKGTGFPGGKFMQTTG